MEYQKKEYDFTLFINKDATGNRPIVSGSIYVNGKDIPICGWKRQTKSGKSIIRGCESQKRERAEESVAQKPVSNQVPFDDGMPF